MANCDYCGKELKRGSRGGGTMRTMGVHHEGKRYHFKCVDKVLNKKKRHSK